MRDSSCLNYLAWAGITKQRKQTPQKVRPLDFVVEEDRHLQRPRPGLPSGSRAACTPPAPEAENRQPTPPRGVDTLLETRVYALSVLAARKTGNSHHKTLSRAWVAYLFQTLWPTQTERERERETARARAREREREGDTVPPMLPAMAPSMLPASRLRPKPTFSRARLDFGLIRELPTSCV